MTINKVSPKKLLNSKWTAQKSINKQKHFIVTEVEYDDDHNVTYCKLQAVINKQETEIDWRELKQSEKWLQGWC